MLHTLHKQITTLKRSRVNLLYAMFQARPGQTITALPHSNTIWAPPTSHTVNPRPGQLRVTEQGRLIVTVTGHRQCRNNHSAQPAPGDEHTALINNRSMKVLVLIHFISTLSQNRYQASADTSERKIGFYVNFSGTLYTYIFVSRRIISDGMARLS